MEINSITVDRYPPRFFLDGDVWIDTLTGLGWRYYSIFNTWEKKMLIDHIIQAKNQARKDRSPSASVLTLVHGECESISKRKGEQITDSLVCSVIKKIIDNNNETLKIIHDQKLIDENKTLEGFLPTQLSEDQLRLFIKHNIDMEQCKNPGFLIKELDKWYPNQYDKSSVSRLFKEMKK